jgi:hypothetical protein
LLHHGSARYRVLIRFRAIRLARGARVERDAMPDSSEQRARTFPCHAKGASPIIVSAAARDVSLTARISALAFLALGLLRPIGCDTQSDSECLHYTTDGGPFPCETAQSPADAAREADGNAAPCEGKSPGTPCSPCIDCDGGAGVCDDAITLGPKKCIRACQSDSECALPAVCWLCPDRSSSCRAWCEYGLCQATDDGCAPSAGYDPCAGKRCNEPCTLCDPAVIDCEEPHFERYCSMSGYCVAGMTCTAGP